MKWDYLFTYTIAHRGMQYYRQNRVQGLIRNGNTFRAWVEGTDDYSVSIDLSDERHPLMECDCPYAGNGINCKHMAAVLYAIEQQFFPAPVSKKVEAVKEVPVKKKTELDKRVYPFGQDPELLWEIGAEDQPEYRYFDLARITKGRVFMNSQVEKASAEIKDQMIILDAVKTGYDPNLDTKNMIALVTGYALFRNIKWNVAVAFNRTQILKMECKVPSCPCNKDNRLFRSSYERTRNIDREDMCVHELALLLMADIRLRENNPGDYTDRYAHKMLSTFRNRRAITEAQDQKELMQTPLSFEPRLTMESSGLHLSLRIGTDKMYVVKNLTEMVNAIQGKRTLELGTKEKLDTSVHPVSEVTGKYYEFVKDIVNNELSRSKYSEQLIARNDIFENIRASVPLYGRRLDDFYELAQGLSMELTDKYSKNSKRRIVFRDKDPKAQLEITREEEAGNFIGIHIEGTVPKLLEGERYVYYLGEHYLNRMSNSAKEKMQPLLDMADYANRIHFDIGRKNLSEFYYRVLPLIEECAEVDQPDKEEIVCWLPPEAAFSFFLDAEGKNVTCKIEVEYGGQSLELYDRESGRVEDADFRDTQLEKEVLAITCSLFPYKDDQKKLFHCGSNPDLVFELLEHGLHRLMEYGQIRTTERFRRLNVRKSAKVSIGVSLESNLLRLEILSDELSREELLEILNQYQEKKNYYRLRNGDFLKLDQENLRELAEMLDAMHVTPKEFVEGKMNLPLYRALYLNRMLEENENLYAERDSRFRKLVKEFKTVRDSDFEVPASLKDVMRSYQKYGFKWLKTLEQGGFGGILADDMGLGKTLQVISVILSSVEKTVPGAEMTSLIVCPASLVYNWKEEFQKFAPAISVLTVTGNQEERKEKIRDWREYNVLITSYDLLKRDIAEYEGKEFYYQIIDEAQYVKNHTTAAAKAVKIVKSKVRFALTGTPIENRLSELWSIFDYLMPGLLYTYDVFKKEFESPIVKYQDDSAMKQLKRMANPFILRRLKSDVLKDLPDKIEEVRYAKMDKEQQNMYDGQVARMQQMLSEQNGDWNSSKIQILAELMRIRQICCDPSLLMEDYHGESAKREACMDLVRSAIEGEHKILIFSQFTSMLALLEADLKKEKIPYFKITGSTPKELRLELVREFNKDKTPVFLISLKAGGTGLNLTGADIVIHYDPWWNLAAQNQATDRAHRIGQKKVVSVFKLIIKDTIEERILEMQEAKKNLAEEVLSGETTGLAALTREELLNLL